MNHTRFHRFVSSSNSHITDLYIEITSKAKEKLSIHCVQLYLLCEIRKKNCKLKLRDWIMLKNHHRQTYIIDTLSEPPTAFGQIMIRIPFTF